MCLFIGKQDILSNEWKAAQSEGTYLYRQVSLYNKLLRILKGTIIIAIALPYQLNLRTYVKTADRGTPLNTVGMGMLRTQPFAELEITVRRQTFSDHFRPLSEQNSI